MTRIALINMPFAAVNLPSIALTQLRSVLCRRLDGRASVEIHYLNHDVAEYLGLERYEAITGSLEATVCGLGDWFFRAAAFPEEADTTEAYFRRYPRLIPGDLARESAFLADRRRGLKSFLDALIDRYRLAECDLVGFTSMFVQNVASFALAARLKAARPSIITVIGGANCETPMGAVIARNVTAIDFVCSGPALKTFPQFVEHLLDGDRDQCHRIVGIYSRQNLATLPGGNPQWMGEELDINEVLPLDYDEFLESLRARWSPEQLEVHLPFETSRGCWWGERAHCTFCGLNGSTMQYRAMAPDLAVAQLGQLFRYYPRSRRFHAVDNILPREYLTDVLPRVRVPAGGRIFYEVKPDLTGAEIATLAAAGVTEVQPGIEALATSTLKLMKKGTTAFKNIAFLKNCLRFGITPHWNLLIGFPGEEEAVYAKYIEDLPRLVHLPPPGGSFPVRFDRYSPYFVEAERYGLRLQAYDSYELIYPFPREELFDLAYYFADRNYSAPYQVLTAKWLRKLQRLTDAWRSRWLPGTADGVPKLELRKRDDAAWVYDSRGSGAEEIPLDRAEEALLAALEVPLDRGRIAAAIPQVPSGELDRRLETLVDRGHVFQEGSRWISLVLPAHGD